MAVRHATLTSANYSLSGLIRQREHHGDIIPRGRITASTWLTATTVTSTALGSSDFDPESGTLLSNYILPTTASGPGTITAKTLTVTGVTQNRLYNGGTGVTFNPDSSMTLNGVVSTDSVTVSGTPAGSFPSKNVGRYTIQVTGLSPQRHQRVELHAHPAESHGEHRTGDVDGVDREHADQDVRWH